MNNTITIDGAEFCDRKTAHKLIAEALNFPDYYGANLDALYDLLAERDLPVTIILANCSYITESLGGYGNTLISTFAEAMEENPAVTVILED